SLVQKWIATLHGGVNRGAVVDRSYLTFKHAGVLLDMDEDSVLRSISLHSGFFEDFSAYKGELPNGLDFGLSRVEVRKRLGEPSRTGEARRSNLGPVPCWDRFDFAVYSMHVQ